ncbi:MAG: SGNH/GDSL hydrolase family protein [archaeon]
MQKRGETVLNFVLMFGILIVSVIAFASLQGIFGWQGRETIKEKEFAFFQNIKSAIERSMHYPSDSYQNVTFLLSEPFSVTIKNNQLLVFFPKTKDSFKETLLASNLNILENDFSTTGKIQVLSRGRNLYVTDKIKCTHSDGVCDHGCIFSDKLSQRCDPDCYSGTMRDYCISYCVDINKDGMTNQNDADGICDMDCYNNERNGGIYDFDCIESNDGICDPDTHLNNDLYCDLDCVGKPPDYNGNIANGICDPDCTIYDIDCPHADNDICEQDYRENCMRDKDCNCEPGKSCRYKCKPFEEQGIIGASGCVDDSELAQRNNECLLSCECAAALVCTDNHCCNEGEFFDPADSLCKSYATNGICDFLQGENCRNNADCNNECASSGKICCMPRAEYETNGCVASLGLGEGEECICPEDCGSGLECMNPSDGSSKKGCCPSGVAWDGSTCGVSQPGCTGNPNTIDTAAFPELFKYSGNNQNLAEAFSSISSGFKEKGTTVSKELLAAMMATLIKEVGGSFSPIEEYGDYCMGPGCTYKIAGNCRSSPYTGGCDYKGRGYIQITHEGNYQTYCGSECISASQDECNCNGQLHCLNQNCPPAKALLPQYAGKIFAGYYLGRGLVDLSNSKQYREVGYRINGAYTYGDSFQVIANEQLAILESNSQKTENLLNALNSGGGGGCPPQDDTSMDLNNKKIVLFGDSITEGHRIYSNNAIQTELNKKFSGVSVNIIGLTGMRADSQETKNAFYNDVLTQDPDVVMFWFGMNSYAGTESAHKSAYDEMINLLSQNNIKAIILNPIATCPSLTGITVPRQIMEYNREIADSHTGAVLIDIYGKCENFFNDPSNNCVNYYVADGVHINGNMHAEIAKWVANDLS